jgi:hypothetical protein
MSGMEITVTLLIVAAVLGVVFKVFSRDETAEASPRSRLERDDDAVPPDPSDFDDDAVGDDEHAAAMTSDGWSFVPMGHGVRLVEHARVAGDAEDRGGLKGMFGGEGGEAPTHGPRFDRLDTGDLIAARVVRGAPDHDPWRLEGLGRDRDYRAWRFETEEAARAAFALVEARVVRPALDADDEPMAIGPADFDAAYREHEEIERELATLADEEPEGERPR